MPRVFVSYRRSDTGPQVKGLLTALHEHLPIKAVFFDELMIEPGEDFRLAILEALRSCDVVLVVIGENWVETFRERASAPGGPAEDHVLVETEMALRLRKIVIPVILLPATPPISTELPKSISEIRRRNALSIDLTDTGHCAMLGREVTDALDRAFTTKLEFISNRIGLPVTAIRLVFDSVKAAAARAADSGESLPASEIWSEVTKQARKTYKTRWKQTLAKLGITRSEDVGMIVFSLILQKILMREETDRPSDFWEQGRL